MGASLAACLAVLALGGASGAEAAPAGWARSDLRPVSQPTAAANRLLVYVVVKQELRLAALDARTGRSVWTEAATTSVITNGVPGNVTAIGRRVFYLRPVGPAARLVAADAESGRDVWVSEPGFFTSWPAPCPGETATVCVTGWIASKPQSIYLLRYGAGGHGLFSTVAISREPQGRAVGPGLFDPGRRKPEVLVATSRARVAWRKPLGRIFTLPGATTDEGWSFDRAERRGVFVGAPGWPPTRRTKSTAVYDAGTSMTAGFRIRDGSVVWRDRGSQYVCGYLPCPGADPAAGVGPTVGVRVRARGTISATPGTLRIVPSRDLRVVLEGFDPGTGRTRWSFDAGHATGLVTHLTVPPLVAADTVALRDRAGRWIGLDLRSGSRRRLGTQSRGWCRGVTIYRATASASRKLETFVGEYDFHPCTSGGRRLPVARSAPAFLGSLAARAGGLVAWSGPAGVFARPVAG